MTHFGTPIDAAVVEELADAGVDRVLFMLPSAARAEVEQAADEAVAVAERFRRSAGRARAQRRLDPPERSPSPYRCPMDPTEARSRFAAARVARLATAGADGRPHLVPVVFALDGDTLYTAVDDVKPKASTTRLRRLRNITENAAVAMLADHYDDDWTALWSRPTPRP